MHVIGQTLENLNAFEEKTLRNPHDLLKVLKNLPVKTGPALILKAQANLAYIFIVLYI